MSWHVKGRARGNFRRAPRKPARVRDADRRSLVPLHQPASRRSGPRDRGGAAPGLRASRHRPRGALAVVRADPESSCRRTSYPAATTGDPPSRCARISTPGPEADACRTIRSFLDLGRTASGGCASTGRRPPRWHPSNLTLPLAMGGEPPIGALGLNTLQEQRDWPDEAGAAAATGRAGLHQRARAQAPRAPPAGERGASGGGRRPRRPRVLRSGLRRRRHVRRRPVSRPLRCSPEPRAGPPGAGVLDGASASRRPRHACWTCAEQLHDGRLERRSPSSIATCIRPPGRSGFITSAASLRRDATGRAVRTFGVLRDITERKRAEDELRDLSRRLIRAHEEERALLARELHDDVTQRLAVLAIDVGRAELAAPDGAQAEAMRSVREGLVRLSEDVHSLAYQLHPSVLEELGLVEALRAECERLGRQGRVDLSVELEPLARGRREGRGALPVPRRAGGAEQRRTRTPARAPRRVALRPMDGGLLLAVRDDGVGFDPAAPQARREPRPGEHARAGAARERHARHRERARPGHDRSSPGFPPRSRNAMSAPHRPRVLLADDHLLVAEALKSLLAPEFDLVGVVEDGRALVEAAGTTAAGRHRRRRHHAPASTASTPWSSCARAETGCRSSFSPCTGT